MTPTYAIIVGHGDMPRALLDAAASIVGSAEGATTLSNIDSSAEELDAALARLIDERADGNVIVFADMYGTSCGTTCARLERQRDNVAVICGVNLPMLVRFFTYRGRKEFAELVRFLLQTGQNEVRLTRT
ncbi:MAG: hypothetical protein ABIK86_00355 [candidate division WOR-3 bacterium]